MFGTTLHKLLSGQSAFLQARHAVVTQNLANSDTPDYQPQDIIEPSFAQMVASKSKKARSLNLERTNGDHIHASATVSKSIDGREKDGYERAYAGNEVIIEEQAQKLQQTKMDYELTTAIYRKFLNMTRTAIGSQAG